MRILTTFIATDDDGNDYMIHVLQGEHAIVGAGGRRSMSPDAMKEMQTDGGRHVNFIGPGEYEVIDGTRAIRVTSTDQNAPQQ
ncbi:MAG: hypothetical protein L0228_05255 [Planctomycetes bacterium]|nr:hypothetical protein [Planctomycetota bacterium]